MADPAATVNLSLATSERQTVYDEGTQGAWTETQLAWRGQLPRTIICLEAGTLAYTDSNGNAISITVPQWMRLDVAPRAIAATTTCDLLIIW